MSKNSRQIDDLQHKLDLMQNRIKDLEIKTEIMWRKWSEFDERVMAVVEGKTQVIVVDSLAAYQKGKKIKNHIDYISDVLGAK